MAKDRIITDRKTGERWYVHGDTGHCANLTNPRPDPIRLERPRLDSARLAKAREMFGVR